MTEPPPLNVNTHFHPFNMKFLTLSLVEPDVRLTKGKKGKNLKWRGPSEKKDSKDMSYLRG